MSSLIVAALLLGQTPSAPAGPVLVAPVLQLPPGSPPPEPPQQYILVPVQTCCPQPACAVCQP